MEDIKSASVDGIRHDTAGLSSPSPSKPNYAGSLPSGVPLIVCQQVATVRAERLFGTVVCGLEPLVYRDTGGVAEVGFGRHAELRLEAACHTSEAIEKVKQFGSRELPRAAFWAAKPTEGIDLAVLARHWQPRVHAAFAFDPKQAGPDRLLGDVWGSFGSAYALVPKLSYVQVRGQSYLCYLVSPKERDANNDASLKHALQRLHEAERLLSNPGAVWWGQETTHNAAPFTADGEPPTQLWNEQINRALGAISDGSLQKVVVARCAEHRFAEPVSLVSALYALGNTHPDSTKFAFRGPEAAFLGATPEHLISKSGQTLSTEALAGTTASTNVTGHAFTPKEYHEHSPVLSAIMESLAQFCRELSHEVTPVPLRLPHVLHLRTAISGTLTHPDTHVLDLVRALHPTPAVAGAPRETALAWLREHEDFARGWYAGPIGWFDADGNGQFDVALRCGILTPSRAILFAGAGIVEGSVPDKEFEETALKLKAMQSALSAGAASMAGSPGAVGVFTPAARPDGPLAPITPSDIRGA